MTPEEYKATKDQRLGEHVPQEVLDLTDILDRLGVSTPRYIARQLYDREVILHDDDHECHWETRYYELLGEVGGVWPR